MPTFGARVSGRAAALAAACGLCLSCAESVTPNAALPSRTAAGSGSASPAVMAPPALARAPARDAVADARHLLNRFAFGPRPGEAELVARRGADAWLEEQLSLPEESPLLTATLAHHGSAYAPAAELLDEWFGEDWHEEMSSRKELKRGLRPFFKRHLSSVASAEITRAILSRRQVEAVMTDFWVNHFNVFAPEGFVRLFEGDYVERALRPNAVGKFSELLVATARHPAMLLYLDNAVSSAERRNKKKRRGGLNENYARELLELHTLGVDGGYTQSDVVAVARILTGWSVERIERGKVSFVFRQSEHDRGEKVVLGRTFPAGRGEEEGVELLRFLAEQPSTARHLARKLCQRFVADDPDPSCVEAAAAAYLESGGDIARVLRTIARHPSFWDARSFDAKLKKPFEFLASAARALDAQPDGTSELARALANLGEPLLQERVPAGYPELEREWASSAGMLARMNFAAACAAERVPGLRIQLDAVLPGAGTAAELVAGVNRLLFAGEAPRDALAIVESEVELVPEPERRRELAVALLLGSPEFQRQ